ncbi:hypothetical protein A4A49_33785 [Nicotiana attenuata]|uniref:Uncharacterized protein n=1 Tax=Nicotiana attenuata TaxID=49451 RepID=A0A1J6IGY4_NICAT|nr:hypothetical protein A4A49_33785 [Nicotiana attenuata]
MVNNQSCPFILIDPTTMNSLSYTLKTNSAPYPSPLPKKTVSYKPRHLSSLLTVYLPSPDTENCPWRWHNPKSTKIFTPQSQDSPQSQCTVDFTRKPLKSIE